MTNEPESIQGTRGETVSAPQCTETPRDLIAAVEARFGPIRIDLCASRANVCESFIGGVRDSLKEDWYEAYGDALLGRAGSYFAWCNPPYGDQGPWLAKLAERKIPALALIPYDSGTKHWQRYVRGIARVEVLLSRVRFVGHPSGFPKPIALLVYEPGVDGAEGGTWNWKGTKR